MNKQDGGPAFPTTPDNYEQMDPAGGGMTLRDYFAAQAVAGLLANRDFTWPTLQQAPLAKAVYEVADAMLAERDKG